MVPPGLFSTVPSWRSLRFWWPWVGLLAGLSLTLAAWLQLGRAEQARLDALKESQASSLIERVEQRMTTLKVVLQGAAGYLGRGALPSRAEWHGYVESLNLPATYPGIQGMGFAEWIPRVEVAGHLQRLRAEGFPDYRILPGGPLPPDPEGCSAIVYLEPMDARNLKAFGKDMYAESVRREAMIRARDTGLPALSGKVVLYQEGSVAVQAGTLLFVPVYGQAQPLETVVQRRRAFRGWAYHPFRMGDLLGATLSRDAELSDFELYDGARVDPERLLFDSDPSKLAAGHGEGIARTFDVAGRTWLVAVRSSQAFLAAAGQQRHLQLLGWGFATSLLIFGLLIVVLSWEDRAQLLAHQRGEALLATESKFHALFERAPMGMAIVDSTTGRFLSVNRRLGEILGYTVAELQTVTFRDVTHPEHVEADLALVQQLVAGRVAEVQREKRYLHRDRHVVWGRLTMVKLPGESGHPPTHLSMMEDITERHHAMAALEASEARFRTVAEESPVALFIHRKGRFLYLNPAALAMLHASTPEQVVGQCVLERIHPDHLEAVKLRMRLGAEQGVVAPPMEQRFFTLDGQVMEAEVQARPIVYEGEPATLVFAHDITERKAAEESLRVSEARLRNLGDQLPDSFLYQMWTDSEGSARFLYLSAGVERLCGLKAEDVLRDSSLLLGQMDPLMVAAYLEEQAACGRDLRPFAMDLRQHRADGSWRWFQVRATPWVQPDGSLIWEGISTDITNQKASRILVEESETRFRDVVENAGEAIYLHDEEGHIFLCNRAACANTGYAMEELLRLRIQELDPEYVDDGNTHSRRSLEPGHRVSILARHRRKDGSTFPVEVRISLLREGEPRQILAVVHDLSQREQIEESEFRARKAESLVLMAGGIAHDFNNLFQGILGYLEIAGVKAGENASLAATLSKAVETLQKAIALSWKMLDFSGRGFLKPEPLDLDAWLPVYVATLQGNLPPTVHLDVSCEAVPSIQGDISKLEQVVEAIVDNAREALGTQGGRIRIRLRADFGEDPTAPGAPGLWPLGRPDGPATVCLEISDDGPGVADDQLNRICDPFYTTKELGRGLGLAATVGILRAHRAGLHILNGKPSGLTLRLHFSPTGV